MLSNGEDVLLYCKNGRTRSPTVAAAFFFIFRGENVESWFKEAFPDQRPDTARVSTDGNFPNFDRYDQVLKILESAADDTKGHPQNKKAHESVIDAVQKAEKKFNIRLEEKMFPDGIYPVDVDRIPENLPTTAVDPFAGRKLEKLSTTENDATQRQTRSQQAKTSCPRQANFAIVKTEPVDGRSQSQPPAVADTQECTISNTQTACLEPSPQAQALDNEPEQSEDNKENGNPNNSNSLPVDPAKQGKRYWTEFLSNNGWWCSRGPDGCFFPKNLEGFDAALIERFGEDRVHYAKDARSLYFMVKACGDFNKDDGALHLDTSKILQLKTKLEGYMAKQFYTKKPTDIEFHRLVMKLESISYHSGSRQYVLKAMKECFEESTLLQFMVQNGIPGVNNLSKVERSQLEERVKFANVNCADLTSSQNAQSLKFSHEIISRERAASLLVHFGFGSCTGHSFQIPNGARLNRPPMSLEEVRKFIRENENWDATGKKCRARNEKDKLGLFSLRLWGATSSAPLPTYSGPSQPSAPTEGLESAEPATPAAKTSTGVPAITDAAHHPNCTDPQSKQIAALARPATLFSAAEDNHGDVEMVLVDSTTAVTSDTSIATEEVSGSVVTPNKSEKDFTEKIPSIENNGSIWEALRKVGWKHANGKYRFSYGKNTAVADGELLAFFLKNGIPRADKLPSKVRQDLELAAKFTNVNKPHLRDAQSGNPKLSNKVMDDEEIQELLCEWAGFQKTIQGNIGHKTDRSWSARPLDELRVKIRQEGLPYRIQGEGTDRIVLSITLWAAVSDEPLPTYPIVEEASGAVDESTPQLPGNNENEMEDAVAAASVLRRKCEDVKKHDNPRRKRAKLSPEPAPATPGNIANAQVDLLVDSTSDTTRNKNEETTEPNESAGPGSSSAEVCEFSDKMDDVNRLFREMTQREKNMVKNFSSQAQTKSNCESRPYILNPNKTRIDAVLLIFGSLSSGEKATFKTWMEHW